jgi:uncharacterized protein (TIGR03437 family)
VLFHDGVYAGNENLIAGAAFPPAKPGDTIVAHGTGLGDVIPASPPGIIVTRPSSLAGSVTFRFGATAADVTYQGLSSGSIGWRQFNPCRRHVSG